LLLLLLLPLTLLLLLLLLLLPLSLILLLLPLTPSHIGCRLSILLGLLGSSLLLRGLLTCCLLFLGL
jgi:hypothetical protein